MSKTDRFVELITLLCALRLRNNAPRLRNSAITYYKHQEVDVVPQKAIEL